MAARPWPAAQEPARSLPSASRGDILLRDRSVQGRRCNGRAGRRLARGRLCQAWASLPGAVCRPEAVQGFHHFELADCISFFMGVADGRGNSSLTATRFAFLRCHLQTPPFLRRHPQAAEPSSTQWRSQLGPPHRKVHAGLWGKADGARTGLAQPAPGSDGHKEAAMVQSQRSS